MKVYFETQRCLTLDDVTDDVSDYVIDFDVSDDVIDFDVDVANFDFSDVGEFDVISTDELTTMLPFDNVTDDVSNQVTNFDASDAADFDINNVDDFDVIITMN